MDPLGCCWLFLWPLCFLAEQNKVHAMDWCHLLYYVFTGVGDPLGTSEFQWEIQAKSSGSVGLFHQADPWKWSWPLTSVTSTHTHAPMTHFDWAWCYTSCIAGSSLYPKPLLSCCLCIRKVATFCAFPPNEIYIYEISGILMWVLDFFFRVEEISPDLVSPTLSSDKLLFVTFSLSHPGPSDSCRGIRCWITGNQPSKCADSLTAVTLITECTCRLSLQQWCWTVLTMPSLGNGSILTLLHSR